MDNHLNSILSPSGSKLRHFFILIFRNVDNCYPKFTWEVDK